MRKTVKYIVIIIVILFSLILIDSIQAKIFNSSPIIHVRKYYNGKGEVDYIDKGILVGYYKYIDGSGRTIFLWENTTN